MLKNFSNRHRPLYAGDPIFVELKMGCPDEPGNDEIEMFQPRKIWP
jgi:hypothetical protein